LPYLPAAKMVKQKKSTKKFLQKSNGPKKGAGGKPAGKAVGGGRSRPKQPKDDLEEEENEQYINLKAPKSEKGASRGTTKSHKDDLKDLQQTDPEFFKFLEKNDSSLLEFGADEDDEEEEDDDLEVDDSDDDDEEDEESGDDDSDDDEMGGAVPSRARKERKRVEITAETIDSVTGKILENNSLNELKKLLSMFRTACIPSGENSEDRGPGEEEPSSSYIIPSPEIYERVMLTSIETVQVLFRKLLDIKDQKVAKATLEGLHSHAKWKKAQLLVVSYFKSMMHLLSGLVSSTQQSSVTTFLVDSLEDYIPFLAPLPRLTKNVLKVLLDLWSHQLDPHAEAPVGDADLVRGHAFLRIRQIAMQLPGAISEECFRSIYLKFARQCKSYSELSAPHVLFMMHSVAELYGVDLSLAYQQSFLYVRQLALHLRAFMLKKSDETKRQVTSMQFLNCIRLWTRVICCHPSSDNGLGALAFPLSQIIFGVIAAAPSLYYTPLRFNLVTCLHQISAACEVFIPTTSTVLEVLEHKDLITKATPSTMLAPKLEQLVKLPANSITKAVVRDVIVQEASQLLLQDAEIYRFHVGLPEYCYLTVRKLKAYLKSCKITKWRGMLRTAAGQMEQYSNSAQHAREQLGRGPMMVEEFEPLLPQGTAISRVRLSKLLSGGKGAVVSVVAGSSTAPKDLFAKSYKAIKADQASAKSAKSRGSQTQKKARFDDESGGDSDGDEEEEEEDSGADSVMDSGEEGYGEEEEDEEEEEAADSNDEDLDEEARKVLAEMKKGVSAAVKKANGKGKKGKAQEEDFEEIDCDGMDDSVGELDVSSDED